MSGLVAHSLKGYLLGVATTEYFAKSALNKLGHVEDCSPCWKHDIASLFLTSLPWWLNQMFMHKLTNKRYLVHKSQLKASLESKKTK